jgi:hypothetical protein
MALRRASLPALGTLRCCGAREARGKGEGNKKGLAVSEALLFLVRPAGRTHLEVQVLHTPDRGKC